MSPSVAVIERKQSIGPTEQSLLSRLPEHLLTRLFGAATAVRLETDEVLFLAGDTGDGCYRVEDGSKARPAEYELKIAAATRILLA